MSCLSYTLASQELNSPHRKRLQVTEIEERRDYESEMADALKQMREESEQHIANSRAELEEVFHKKVPILNFKCFQEIHYCFYSKLAENSRFI